MPKEIKISTREEKFIEYRNELINDIVEEMGEEKAFNYLSIPRNRENIEEIARYKARIAPLRDISIANIQRKKWSHNL